LRPEQISFGKLNNVREAIKVAREARTILGGNGVTLDYPVMRHANNLDGVRTYEGTDEVHILILGNAITGIPAFRQLTRLKATWGSVTITARVPSDLPAGVNMCR
jgi:glutaryl-CoA dehydrogenase